MTGLSGHGLHRTQLAGICIEKLMAAYEGIKRLKKLRAHLTDEQSMSDGRRAKMYVGNLGAVPICIVFRNSDQIFRGGRTTLSEASNDASLCWMMDTPLVSILRETYRVEFLLTLERETGDLWVSKLADWSDPDKLFALTDPSLMVRTYRGASLTYLPVKHMVHVPCDRQLISRSRGRKR